MIALILFFIALCYAAFIDIKNHVIDPKTYILLLIAALVNLCIYKEPLADKLMAFFFIGGAMLLIAVFRDDIGGGDVKLIAVSSLCSGVSVSINAMLLTWLAACLYMLLSGAAKEKKPIPMAPFILLGYSITYINKNVGGFI